jgi:hypothetical protein
MKDKSIINSKTFCPRVKSTLEFLFCNFDPLIDDSALSVNIGLFHKTLIKKQFSIQE